MRLALACLLPAVIALVVLTAGIGMPVRIAGEIVGIVYGIAAVVLARPRNRRRPPP